VYRATGTKPKREVALKIPAVGGGSVRLAEIDNPLGLSWTGDQTGHRLT
jgi:hypothetical protein